MTTVNPTPTPKVGTYVPTGKPTPDGTWLSIDSRRPLAAVDQALVTRFAEALGAGDRLHLELPSLLHLMRANQAGQPRAASYTPATASRDDRPDHGAVDGEAPTGHHDPAGDAATGYDAAARDLREMRRHLEQAMGHIAQAVRIGNAYPSQPVEIEDEEPGPGETWCRTCWKDGRYCQPITTRPDGSAYYRGQCKWCGQMTKVLTAEPPTWMVEKRHRGEVITEGAVVRAQDEIAKARAAAQAEAKAKRKGKAKR